MSMYLWARPIDNLICYNLWARPTDNLISYKVLYVYDSLILRLFNDAVSATKFIPRQNKWEYDHEF